MSDFVYFLFFAILASCVISIRLLLKRIERLERAYLALLNRPSEKETRTLTVTREVRTNPHLSLF